MKMKVGKLEFDPKEVIQAYATMFTATDEEKNHAEKREEICKTCDKYYEESILGKKIHRCKECGCVIEAKAYTRRESACPLDKWSTVDAVFFGEHRKRAMKNKKFV